jgi:F-type H+-transporting ATPase subunit b
MTILAFAEGGGSIISPDGSLVVVLILFMLFVFVLNRLLFKPIGRVLDERQARIEGDTAEARAATRNSGSRLAEYEAAIKNARNEGYRRIEQERTRALQQRQQMIDDVKQKSASEIDRAKNEIAGQAAAARAQLDSEARQVAERISQVLLGRTVGGGQ